MEYNTINALITENMKTILGFALSRLSDRHEAEDLAGNIILEILKSARRLHDDSRFYAFMWKIAENTYSNFLRARIKNTADELDENVLSDEPLVEDAVILREDMRLLRRELSLLSEQYRQSTVLYYMKNLSCGQISERLGISTEMVKYYLFRARKILREGLNMERILGEKSYDPKPFKIDFWGTSGGEDREYTEFQTRKIRGNILLSAYYTAVTAQELSMELGVALPYLEDELGLLLKRQYLAEKNGKYQTNIPIFTMECSAEMEKVLTGLAEKETDTLISLLENECAALREQFGELFQNENLLRWHAVTLCSHFALEKTDNYVQEKYSDYPDSGPYSLVNGGGGKGFVWGRSADDMAYKFHGIYDGWTVSDGRGSIVAFNFSQIQNANFDSYMADMVSCAAVGCFQYLDEKCQRELENGHYTINGRPNFPVYADRQMENVAQIFSESVRAIEQLSRQTCEFAGKITADHSPEHIRNTAAHLGAITCQHDSLSYVVTALMDKGWLKPANDSEKPAMFVISHCGN